MNFTRITLLSLLVFLFSCGTNDTANKVAESATKQTDNQTNTKTKALSLEEKIQAIKSEFQRIEAGQSTFEKKGFKEDDEAIIELEGYYEGGELVKLNSKEMFSHGTDVKDYYLKGGKLFFVLETRYAEASVMGPFTDTQMRSYLGDDGAVIRVLQKEKTVKENTPIDLSKVKNIDITKKIDDKMKWGNDMRRSLKQWRERLD